MIENTVYDRPITHPDYLEKYRKRVLKNSTYVAPFIYEEFGDVNSEEIKDPVFWELLNDKYVVINPMGSAKAQPIWGGGIALIFMGLLSPGFFNEEEFTMTVIFFCFSTLALIFCIYYYFSLPQKEKIYDRLAGTITFPGFMREPNITMPFANMLHVYTTGDDRGLGAFRLDIVRPTRGVSSVLIGNDCYHSMSFITWYMDKNRPLPPGTAFDPYRKADFERRKAEGFPPPLYPSRVPTPEATPEQQKEREQFWRD